MPELPEVECLMRAVRTLAEGAVVHAVEAFRADLRDPIPLAGLREILVGQTVRRVFRRSKYLLLETDPGFAIVHLGMTGNLLRESVGEARRPHTHVVLALSDRAGVKHYLHYVDPRRFGRFDCYKGKILEEHPFFSALGPEPLDEIDLGGHLWKTSRSRQQPIKTFLMDPSVVVGVGNIYASEALFRAGIKPTRPAGSVSQARLARLGLAVQETLAEAIRAGGTTFRDFRNADAAPGYFAVSLAVYGREGETCRRCAAKVRQVRLSGRSTFYCPVCQKS